MIEFTEQHLGLKVWSPQHGNGEIIDFYHNQKGGYPVVIRFTNGVVEYFNTKGYFKLTDKRRTLFVGHDLEMTVKEQPLPEPEPVCPFCGVVHELMADGKYYTILTVHSSSLNCPLFFGYYFSKETYCETIERIKEHMKNA